MIIIPHDRYMLCNIHSVPYHCSLIEEYNESGKCPLCETEVNKKTGMLLEEMFSSNCGGSGLGGGVGSLAEGGSETDTDEEKNIDYLALVEESTF